MDDADTGIGPASSGSNNRPNTGRPLEEATGWTRKRMSDNQPEMNTNNRVVKIILTMFPLRDWKQLEKVLLNNIDAIKRTESLLQIMSYALRGRYIILSELLFTVSNSLSLWTALMAHKYRNASVKLATPLTANSKRVRTWLTVLEYFEVILELGCLSRGGETSRWIIVVVIQVVKCLLRLYLQTCCDSGIIPSDPLLFHPDMRLELIDKRNELDRTVATTWEVVDGTEGRVVSRSQSAQCLSGQFGSPRSDYLHCKSRLDRLNGFLAPSTRLNHINQLGETLHSLRPVINLACSAALGSNSWATYKLSMAVDIVSILLFGFHDGYNLREQHELQRRFRHLFLYLLRSPFYDEFTKSQIVDKLQKCVRSIPVVRSCVDPLMNFLEEWQSLHSYQLSL